MGMHGNGIKTAKSQTQNVRPLINSNVDDKQIFGRKSFDSLSLLPPCDVDFSHNLCDRHFECGHSKANSLHRPYKTI